MIVGIMIGGYAADIFPMPEPEIVSHLMRHDIVHLVRVFLVNKNHGIRHPLGKCPGYEARVCRCNVFVKRRCAHNVNRLVRQEVYHDKSIGILFADIRGYFLSQILIDFIPIVPVRKRVQGHLISGGVHITLRGQRHADKRVGV